MKSMGLESATTGKPTNESGCQLKSAADIKIVETCERIQTHIIDLHEVLNNYKPSKQAKMYNDNHLFI